MRVLYIWCANLNVLPDAARFKAWFSWMSLSISALSAVPPSLSDEVKEFSRPDIRPKSAAFNFCPKDRYNLLGSAKCALESGHEADRAQQGCDI